MASIDTFWTLGLAIAKHGLSQSTNIGMRRFRGLFGVGPDVCLKLWDATAQVRPTDTSPVHLLWMLLFLKGYRTEAETHALIGADEKTLRKWLWPWIETVAKLEIIDWEARRIGARPADTVLVSLDGTDCRIYEPTPFDKKWYSHKFHGPGVRYEVGLCIATGDIVWAFGGVPCGEWPDLTLARHAFVHMLDRGEKALADKGYRDPVYFRYPDDGGLQTNRRQKKIMARHETVNRRLKQFRVLQSRFRHALEKHPICFHAVVNITQLDIACGHKLFGV
ncbi:hypothetical protein SPRG_12241 [Saprolegnia parasitica CBS 223.65]|uniref:DDE Tnp4 domain-containing protein n=1 Tax=Saprolegnia parasitica (strain CBS 223.65) TaxID=695850 RepID=A0A067C5D7_SAPPC|nr:hypothetical protein SPRG_12241 [Saprolegnia parasitica CBS 223.65]KDO22032.1 hypothetical protein SPRG_12241 [Saprolegnia parasitica CBS 223.65]|eukprot:XP_012207275.1 hypothetical protein SPRG_12241 [Saprolegnia parasitica CBS 223.65]